MTASRSVTRNAVRVIGSEKKGGKVQKGDVFGRAAGERGPVSKRDEGPGETEGVSSGAIRGNVTQSGPGNSGARIKKV